MQPKRETYSLIRAMRQQFPKDSFLKVVQAVVWSVSTWPEPGYLNPKDALVFLRTRQITSALPGYEEAERWVQLLTSTDPLMQKQMRRWEDLDLEYLWGVAA